MLGVIGGMGPAATADFFVKLIEETPAENDEGHIPTLVVSDPRVPSRTAAILDGGASPLPALRAIRDKLIAAGATMLAMPCNTAHAWHGELARDCTLPFPSIVEASADALRPLTPAGAAIGIVATRATLAARIFEPALEARGHRLLPPSEADLAGRVLPSILAVKEGRARDAGLLLEPAIRALLERGAAAVILACTETPIALDAVGSPLRSRCVDSNRALARVCVARWFAGRDQTAAARSA